MINIYVIKNPDGLYSNGGLSPKFGSKPKIWTRAQDAKCSNMLLTRILATPSKL